MPLTELDPQDKVVYFPAIYGGRYVFAFFQSGLIRLYDTHFELEVSERLAGCDLLIKDDYQPSKVGRVLASHQLPRAAYEYDYQVLESGEVILGIIVNTE